ncbi:ACP S-malonyltransferase [Profundibacter sp.]|uniref:ACP S-malonyltransferase n=1 Tax=Profundibacter sp. TaxID=3101071 RepID=UPI003D0B5085
MRKTAVLICPGRGTYNAPELGYISRHFGAPALLAEFDAYRAAQGQETVSALDGAEKFSARLHTRGDNASPLIYAASLLDAQAISADYDIVAVTGNSMGWYIALAAGGALDPMAGFAVVNTMGTLMQEHLIGGQVLYPFVDDNWQEIPGKRNELLALVADIDGRGGAVLAVSIRLGGMLVLAGNDAGLKAFKAAVPAYDRYPLLLPNHAAFHTDLQEPVAAEGRARLGADLFGPPKTPLIDGRGAIWWPHATDAAALRAYTLGAQVTETYDFTRAIQVAAREFAPDVFIVTGPGATLGGAIAQSLIAIDWDGMDSKAAFQKRQLENPVLIAMGRDDQRKLATR